MIVTHLPFQFLPLVTLATLGLLVRRIALERHAMQKRAMAFEPVVGLRAVETGSSLAGAAR
jgi:hypothetical protein